MDANKLKAIQGQRRKYRVRKAIRGTASKPRLSVFRSNLHIYAQLIDDENMVTLAAASTSDKGDKATKGGNVAAATLVGQKLAEKAKAKGISQAAFDRGNYRFHGRVKALARAATEAGLVCTGLVDAAPKVAKEAAPAAPTKKDKKADKAEKADKQQG